MARWATYGVAVASQAQFQEGIPRLGLRTPESLAAGNRGCRKPGDRGISTGLKKNPTAPEPHVVKGAWWDSARPDERCAGELRIGGSGRVELLLESIALHASVELAGLDDKTESRTYHGHDEHGHPWTLLGCVGAGSTKSAAVTTRRRTVAHAVRGMHRLTLDEVTFDEVQLDFTDLQEWLCTPILHERHPREAGQIVVEHPPEAERVMRMQRGYSLVLRMWLGGGANNDGLRFNCQQAFELRFDAPASLRQLKDIVLDLQWFLTLARGEPVQVLKVTGVRNGLNTPGTDFPEIIEVYQGWSGHETASRTRYRWEMLFNADDLGEQLGPMLDRWHAYRDRHAAVLSCYFATRFNEHLYSNHEFLFLAHALELYHQLNFPGNRQPPEQFKARIETIAKAVPDEADWLKARLEGANRLTLADRLRVLLEGKKALIAELIPEHDKFVAAVKDTRNYYTHYDEALKRNGRVADGVELLKLSVRMRALLEACFLSDLGAPEKAVKRVLKDDRIYVAAP